MPNEMTAEEAIKVFKSELDWAEQNRFPYISENKVKATKLAIQALEQTRWIPVSERLPETDGRYYVTIFNHLPCVSNKTSVRILDFWVDGVDFHGTTVYWGFYSGFSTSEIIAWMPLPEPYKECEADD